jgi:hypothetical protein
MIDLNDSERTALASIWPPTSIIAEDAGHEPMSLLKPIRLKCLDCSGHQVSEVRQCRAVDCALWPFRAGVHPYTQKARERAGFSGEDVFVDERAD